MDRLTVLNIDFFESSSVCRLCLKISSGGNIQSLEGFTTYMLKLVAPEMKLEISSEPKICKNCAEKVKLTYDFKLICFEINETSQPAFHKKMQKENVCNCCLCRKNDNLKKCKANEILLLTAMLEKCLPELDMENTSTICQECLRSVVNLFAFFNCCRNTEDKINKYVQVKGLNEKGQVSILDIFYENIIVTDDKPEEVEVENPEEVEEVKNLEESLEGPEPVDRIHCEDWKYHSDVDSEAEVKIDISENTLKMEVVDDCEESTQEMNGKQGTSQRVNCEVREALPSQNMQHCKVSAFSTGSEKLFDRHLLKHKNSQECKPFSCPYCPYRAKRRNRLRDHLLVHKDKSDIVTFNCHQCTYKAKCKETLKRHMVIHKKREECELFSCAHCPYKAKQKRTLKYHLLTHKAKSELNTYNCDRCPYKAKRKPLLNKHMLIHKIPQEWELFSCPHCPYKAKRKRSLKSHLLRHIFK